MVGLISLPCHNFIKPGLGVVRLEQLAFKLIKLGILNGLGCKYTILDHLLESVLKILNLPYQSKTCFLFVTSIVFDEVKKRLMQLEFPNLRVPGDPQRDCSHLLELFCDLVD